LKIPLALILVCSFAVCWAAQSLSLHSIRVSATIELQTGDYWIDVDPTFVLELPPGNGLDYWGLGLPHLAILQLPDVESDYAALHSDPTLPRRLRETRDAVVEHEILHTRQWNALGPAFPLVYAVSLGAALEPHDDFDLSAAWSPPPELEQCPLFRFGSSNGLLPCWRF
jgi:hypothetical protein